MPRLSHTLNGKRKTRNTALPTSPRTKDPLKTHHRPRLLFWSGDSASTDEVGDWAVGDLLLFLLSSTPFSASELEKKEKRFTLDIRREVDGDMMRGP